MEDPKLRALRLETEAAAALREALADFAGDDQLLADMIEGETGFYETLDVVVESIALDEAMLAGLKKHIDAMGKRKRRINNRRDQKRASIEQALTISDLKNIERPGATLTLKTKPRALLVSQESDIPPEFWRKQDPELDRTALADALNDGQKIPGAQLDNGGTSLQIRTQ